MLRFKQFLIEGGRVRPSKLSNDPAFRISDLSNEFAAFPPDQSLGDFMQSYTRELINNKDVPKYQGTYKEFMSVMNDPNLTQEQKGMGLLAIGRSHVDREQKLLDNPGSFIPDASGPKKINFFKSPETFAEINPWLLKQQKFIDKFGEEAYETIKRHPPTTGSYLDKPKLPINVTATKIVPDKTKSMVQTVAKGAKPLKSVGKVAAKMLPVIGTAASIAAMADRAQAGDYLGAGLEAASEVADYIPGIGTAASMGIQGYLADRDMTDEERKESKEKAARQALRSMNVHSPKY